MQPPRRTLTISLTVLALLAAGCAGLPPRHVATDGHFWDGGTIDQFVSEHPMVAGMPLAIHELGRTGTASLHVVQLQGAEAPHIHRAHDVVVIVRNGEGVIHLGQQSRSLGPGAVIEIPRGVRHYAVNEGRRPLVAIVVFTPPFDGRDVVPTP